MVGSNAAPYVPAPTMREVVGTARRRRPDLALVLLIVLAVVVLAILTFELWVPHPWSRH